MTLLTGTPEFLKTFSQGYTKSLGGNRETRIWATEFYNKDGVKWFELENFNQEIREQFKEDITSQPTEMWYEIWYDPYNIRFLVSENLFNWILLKYS